MASGELLHPRYWVNGIKAHIIRELAYQGKFTSPTLCGLSAPNNHIRSTRDGHTICKTCWRLHNKP